MAHGEGIEVFSPMGKYCIRAEGYLIRPRQTVIPLYTLGRLRRMQITEVVYALALQILITAVCFFLDSAGLHLYINLGAVIGLAIYVKALRLFFRVAGRYLVVAHDYIDQRALEDGGDQVHQHRFCLR